MKKPKLEDVAKLADVSPTTVSRVINNRGAISKKTKIKVQSAMEELNYFPNEIARSLFGKKTNTIGILFPNLDNPFFGEMTTKLEKMLAKKNYKVLICNTDNDLEKESNYLKMLLANQVDGIIVGSHNIPSDIYKKANLPIVSIDRFVSDNVPIVRSDNYTGATLATKYLIEKKCKNIALLSGSDPLEIRNGDERIKGYLDTLRKFNMTDYSHFVEFDSPIETQQAKTIHFLKKFPEVDGVFATGDTIAGLLYQEAKKINREIEIVGYDGTELFLNYFRNFTTIKQPIEEMVTKTVEILLEFIDGNFRSSQKEFVFDVELIEYSIKNDINF